VNSIPAKKADAQPKPEATAHKPQFERCLARLEEIVRQLENANLSLDEAMKLFEEGVTLSRDCQKQLEQAEGRVEILMKKAGGELVAQPFEPEGEEEV
jgi:exodeoxyribonuclease VII small subunit